MSSEMMVTDAMVRAFVDSLPAVYAFDAPPPSAVRAGLEAAISLLARTEAGPSLLCQSYACAHKGTAHNFCTPRTEAGADGAVAFRIALGDCIWQDRVFHAPSHDLAVERGTPIEYAYAHPQDASGDAESTALYLRPYDVTMIGQAKHAGQDMVSVLAHLHPTEGWDVRFNVAMQAKEAK